MKLYYLIYFKSDKTFIIDKSTKFPTVDESTKKVQIKWNGKWFVGKIVFQGTKEMCEKHSLELDDAVDLRTTDESSNETELPKSKKASLLSPASRSEKENKSTFASANNTPIIAGSQRKFQSLLEGKGHFSATNGNSRISIDKTKKFHLELPVSPALSVSSTQSKSSKRKLDAFLLDAGLDDSKSDKVDSVNLEDSESDLNDSVANQDDSVSDHDDSVSDHDVSVDKLNSENNTIRNKDGDYLNSDKSLVIKVILLF
jgi:hypothetical protein